MTLKAIRHSGKLFRGNPSSARARAGVVGSLLALALTSVGVFAVSLRAEETKAPPTIDHVRTEGLRPTSTGFQMQVAWNGIAASAVALPVLEYATSESGPWTPVTNVRLVQTFSGGAAYAASVNHLVPNTLYYARLKVTTPYGEAQKTIQFTTPAVEAPQFETQASVCKGGKYFAPESEKICGEAGASIAEVGVTIYSGGVETTWSADYSTEKSAAEKGTGVAVPGGSGTIAVAEEEEQFKGNISGLAVETTYYVCATASNANGAATHCVSFLTSAKPSASDLTAVGVAGSSARVTGHVVAREQETSWRFEYATAQEAQAEHWNVGPEDVIPAVVGDDSFHTVEGELTGLATGTTYYVRLFAENKYGNATSDAYGGFQTFSAPSVTSFATHAIHGESLRLLGSLTVDAYDAEQYIKIQGSPTGGSYTLSFGSATTSALPFNATPAQVQTALEALPSIGAGNIEVADPDYHLGYLIYHVKFVGADSVTAEPQIAANGSGLTPSGSVEVLTTLAGGGGVTHYHFEYVPERQFEASGFSGATSTPEVSVAGEQPEVEKSEVNGHQVNVRVPTSEVVGEDVPGLKSGASYEFRLVASNDEGSGEGSAQRLTVPVVSTDGGAGESCPNAALRTGPSAVLPSCRGYEQVTPVDKQGADDTFTWGIGGEQDFSLVGEDGDHVFYHSSLLHPGSNAAVFNSGFFFSRTGEGRWSMTSGTPQPETGFNAYSFGGGPLLNADLTEVGFTSSWKTQATQSPTESLKLGPPGGPYTTVATVPHGDGSEPNKWIGASADFHTLVLRTDDHTLSGRASGTVSGNDLYEYVEGRLRQLNVDSSGKTIGACGAGLASGFQGGESEASGIHAISADGSKVFFEASPGSNCSEQHLYMRVAASSTVDIGPYRYIGASADGAKVLVEKRNGQEREFFLYEAEGGALRHLLSMNGIGNLGTSTGIMVSDDLNVLYFATGNNVYTYDIATEKLQFAFVIGPQPAVVYSVDQGPYMSPDGRFFYWRTQGNPGIPAPEKSLSENGEVVTRAEPQLYRYDRAERSVECVSCASPYDPEPMTAAMTEVDDNQRFDNSANGVPEVRIASDDGSRVFFLTASALVPQDINGEAPIQVDCVEHCEYPMGSPSLDAYEWRRPGLDGCGRIEGCIALISGGREALRTRLLGTTPSGNDVFFATHEALVSQDADTAGDIYDARIDGGEPPSPPRAAECEGDSCASPPAAPIDSTPASLAFAGPGNPSAGQAAGAPGKSAVKPKGKRRGKRKRRGGRGAHKPHRKARGSLRAAGSRRGGRR